MAADLTIKRNDSLPIITVVCRDSIGPVDLSGYTALFRMVNVLNGVAKVNAAAAIVSDPVFTADATTNALTSTSHDLNDGDDVTLKSSGVLPGGLTTQRKYYVVNSSTNLLQLALTLGGSAIDITSAGSGTHTLLAGKVNYEWAGTDKDTAGTYFGEVQTTDGSGKQLTYPNDGHLTIEVISDLG
jgi:hypothetical protein